MSMTVITLSSSFKTNMSHPSSSSHINGSKEAFVLKLVGTKSSTISNYNHCLLSGKNLNTDDSEIDVFDAEKYFNQGSNQSPKLLVTKNLLPSNYSLHPKKLDPLEEKAHEIEAPSIVSEPTSDNGRRTLLHNVSRIHRPKRTMKKSFLASIGCDLSCCEKNYVDIDDNNDDGGGAKKNRAVKSTEESMTSRQVDDHLVRKLSNLDYKCVSTLDDEPELRVGSNGHFSFPVLNSQTTKKQMNEANVSTKPEPLQVFGQENGKKRTVSTWDAFSKPAEEIVKIPSISSEMQQKDSDSDSSSDLFEIESFSKSNNPFLTRQEESGIGTACDYAPSEASIEWSVVTASAADFSVLSDCEDVKANSNSSLSHHHKERGLKSKIRSVDECNKRRSSALFMGCKSHKAVNVIGDTRKGHEKGSSDIKRRHHSHRAESFTQMTRFYHESKRMAHDQFNHARNRQRSLDALGLPPS